MAIPRRQENFSYLPSAAAHVLAEKLRNADLSSLRPLFHGAWNEKNLNDFSMFGTDGYRTVGEANHDKPIRFAYCSLNVDDRHMVCHVALSHSRGSESVYRDLLPIFHDTRVPL